MKGYAKVLRDDKVIREMNERIRLVDLYAKEWKRSVRVVEPTRFWQSKYITFADVWEDFKDYVEIKDLSRLMTSYATIKFEDSVWLQYTPKMQAMKMIVTLFEVVDEVYMDDELKRVWNEFRVER